jgi:hypothetical protein
LLFLLVKREKETKQGWMVLADHALPMTTLDRSIAEKREKHIC